MAMRLRNLALVCVAVLASNAFASSADKSPDAAVLNQVNNNLIDTSLTKEGQYSLYTVNSKPLFVYRPSKLDLRNLKIMDSKVWDKTISSYVPQLKIFVYWGDGTRLGCPLQFEPHHNSDTGTWLGGYYSTCGDLSYDIAGRAIEDFDYAYFGYNGETANLPAPAYRVVDQNRILILSDSKK